MVRAQRSDQATARTNNPVRKLSRRAYLKYTVGLASAAVAVAAGYYYAQYLATSRATTERTSASQPLSPIHSLIVEPDDGRTLILGALQEAKRSVDLTIYELNDPEVDAALVSAHDRGVKVRVLYNYYSFISQGRNPNESAVNSLNSAGIQSKPASSSFLDTHQKTFVIDTSEAIIMTFNLQPNYFQGTRDFGIITTNPAEIAEIQRVFEADWNYQPATVTQPTLVWSPINSRKRILGVVNDATKTLMVYNEEIQDEACIQALISAASRGVSVRLISAQLMQDERDANAPRRQTLNNGGVDARAGTSLYIHAKMILADYGTGRQVAFVGSENFSDASLDKNRELGILVEDKTILDRLNIVFERDWAEESQ